MRRANPAVAVLLLEGKALNASKCQGVFHEVSFNLFLDLINSYCNICLAHFLMECFKKTCLICDPFCVIVLSYNVFGENELAQFYPELFGRHQCGKQR